MWHLWMASAALASSALAPPLTAPFVEWHCSAENPVRYEGPAVLAEWTGPAPRRPASVSGPERWASVAPTGVGLPRGRVFQGIAIDAATPASSVGEGLRVLAAELQDPRARWLALRLDDGDVGTRPPVPLVGEALDRFHAAERSLEGADVAATIRFLRDNAAGCQISPAVFLASTECTTAAAQLVAALARPACARSGPELLAGFGHLTGASGWNGVPVALVRIGVVGSHVVEGDGTWGERATFYAGRDDLGMAPLGRTEPGDSVPRQPEPSVRRRVVPLYPEVMRSKRLGPMRCIGIVEIDEEGFPYDIQVDGCPTGFREPTREALSRWRWTPPKQDGVPVRTSTTVSVDFPRG